MPKIKVLPDILASQVAAGEVVERPASVVKELVENSIDAGAGEIRIDIDRGGAALIRVSDDGCGMSREDALLSLERHATSKLRTSADLGEIRTLGFRGEAVPSIASVSRFRMLTREPHETAGTEILVDGGKIRDVRDAGCAPGTVIEAKALFYNMPARRKFMRAETTEAAHIEHQVRLHALAAPQVRFRLRRDDGDVFDLPPAPRALDRVRQIVGTGISRELISLPETPGNGVSVAGFILPAAHARKGRRHQFVFLNGRPVEDAVISRALAEGFRGALGEGLQPAAWLWIDLEPGLVDVNVHPAKREVRFRRPSDIRDAILEATAAGLAPAAPQPRPAPSLPVIREQPAVPSPPAPARSWAAVSRAVQPQLPVQPRPPSPLPLPQEAPPGDPAPSFLPQEVPAAVPEKKDRFRMLSVLHQRYVLMEGDEGLVVLDPRAARERILYEDLMRRHDGGMEVQSLLVPVLLDLDPRDLEILLREQAALAEMGIEITGFGGNTLRIASLPTCIPVEEPRPFLGALLDELLHESVPGKRFAFDRMARLLARKASLGARASLAETPALLDELFACELPYCAADGRPTLSEISLKELDRRFSGGK